MKTASPYKSFLYFTGCCFFMLFTLNTACAQVPRGRVEVIKDPRIDTLAAHRLNPEKGGRSVGSFSSYGYRVQIYNGSNRNDAFKAQTKFQEKYPEIRTYIAYKEPNFKVKVGDFRTRLEASKMQYELKPWFPLMFIISEKINPPKLDTDTQQ